MSEIPEELRLRWAERDRSEPSPDIPTINLTEYASEPMALDSLDEPIAIPSVVKDSRPPDSVPHSVTPLSTDLLKLYGVQSAGIGSINIADYKPSKFVKYT